MADTQNVNTQTADLEEIYGGTDGFWDDMFAEIKSQSVEETSAVQENSDKNWEGASVEFWENMLGDASKDLASENVLAQRTVEPTAADDLREIYGATDEFVNETVPNAAAVLNETKASASETTPASQAQPKAQGQNSPDFSEGFKLSDHAKDRLDEQYNTFSVVGIMERFASAKEPEDAFMAMFLGMMLYLPNKAFKYMEQKDVEAKEKAKYIESQTQRYDDALAKGRDWSGNDQFNMVYKDFVETFGNMPQMAAKLRKEHPELVEGLGLKFDENGRLEGKLTNKQIKVLSERVIANNYDKTYGHRPTKEQLNGLWADCNNLLRTGIFAQVGQQRVADSSARLAPTTPTPAPAVQNTPITATVAPAPTPAPAVQTPTVQNTPVAPTVAQADVAQAEPEPTPVDPTPLVAEDYTIDTQKASEVNISVDTQRSAGTAYTLVSEEAMDIPQAEPVVPVIPSVEVEDLQVNTQALTEETVRDRVIAVDAKPLDARSPMNLQKAHAFSLSVSTPAILKDEVAQFNGGFGGIRAKEQEVLANREALNAARQPRSAINQNANNRAFVAGQQRA